MKNREVLLAPNGKPSNLTPEQWRLVRSTEFKRWFGDWEKLALTKINDSGIDDISLKRLSDSVSQILDKNGEPLVVYRGMPTKRKYGNVFKYNVNLFGSSGVGGRQTNKFAFYFTDNKEVATSYAENLSEDERYIVKPYFLNVKKLFKAFKFKNQTEMNFSELYDLANDTGAPVLEKWGYFGEKQEWLDTYYGFRKKYRHNLYPERIFSFFVDWSKDDANQDFWRVYLQTLLGYDGLVFYEDTHNYHWVDDDLHLRFDEVSKTYGVFEPEQIKTADGTNTTFDVSNPDIRFAQGGRTVAQTPSPLKDRIYGSQVNPKKSSANLTNALKIEFSDSTLKTIKEKVEKHNSEHPNKPITLESAKAVVRRGMGAYSKSHRPTISGGKPNSRVAWGLARLNAFIYKILKGKSKSGKYRQDDDLIRELGYNVSRFDNGGKTEVPTMFFGSQAGGVLIYCKSTERYLILLRSPYVLEPFTWGIISGKLDDGENIEETVRREAIEETGYKLPMLYPSYVFERPNFKFYNFLSVVNEEFVPKLNWENISFAWVKLENMPENLHFGLIELLKNGNIEKTVKQITSRFNKGKNI